MLLVLTLGFAPYIAMMFTWSKQAAVMNDDLIRFLRIVFLGHPGFAVVMMTGALFIGIGKSLNSLHSVPGL